MSVDRRLSPAMIAGAAAPNAPVKTARPVGLRQPAAVGSRSAAIGLTVATRRHDAKAPYWVPNLALSTTCSFSFE